MEEMHRLLDIATNPFSSYRMHKTRKGKGTMPQVCQATDKGKSCTGVKSTSHLEI